MTRTVPTPRTRAPRRDVVATILLLVIGLVALVIRPAVGANPRAVPTDPVVGVHLHAGWIETDRAARLEIMDLLAAAGVERIRVDLSWAGLEPDGPGIVDPYWDDRVASILADAAARDLGVLAVMWQTPVWASASGVVQAVPDDPEAYGRFLASFAQRHGDGIAAYEIWNEPNEDDFFLGDANDYVALLRSAATALRANDPTADIVLGAPTYNDTNWLAAVYDAGAGGNFDVMATHPYLAPSDMPPETTSASSSIYLLTHVAAVQELMADNGDDDLPIWFTEFGWHTAPSTEDDPPWERGVSETLQAEYLVRTIDLVAQRYPRVEEIYWYNARDRNDSHARNNSYGLLERDLTPKPAYWALQRRLTGVTRLAGADRVATSVLAANRGWPDGSATVLLARSDLPSDAVVAAPLAATLAAPILLTPSDRLDPRTSAALSRLGATHVMLIGGPVALSADVEELVRRVVPSVQRLAGEDRAATSVQVARRLTSQDVIVVDGWGTAEDPVWADAIIGAGVSLEMPGDVPLLLARDPLPTSVAELLDERSGSITVIGTGATSSATALRARGDVLTIIGEDVVSTSERAVAAVPPTGDGPFLLATSTAFPDGLVGAALADRIGARVVLVDPAADGSRISRTVSSREWLVMGGQVALPEGALPRH